MIGDSLNLAITKALFCFARHEKVLFRIENILRGFNIRGISHDYYYCRTGAGAEVDLILEGEFGLLPIEIKYGQAVSLRDLRGIRDFIKERGCRYGIVINNDDRVRLYEDNLIGISFGAI